MSRSKSFLSGAFFSYLYQGGAMLAGLWLTPLYLRVLGAHDYGIWLVALQVLTFIWLADLGVLGVVPRDVAREHGRELSDPQSDCLRVLVAQTTRVVLFQSMLVCLIAVGVFLFRVRGNASVEGPVGLVLSVFVLTYPLRLFPAVLNGLQDLKFLGQVRMWTWAIATGVTVVLLLMGARYYALAAGWCLQELAGNLIGLWRLRKIRSDLVSFSAWKVAGPVEWRWFTRGLWVSSSQVSTWLLSGADVLIVARVLGPATVVIYSCTAKLVTVLQNQPQMLASIALPGLSQMKTSESRDRTRRATVCLTQGMLFVAGAVFSVVLALNHQFVNLWVGAKFFGGVPLTLLVLANFMIRLIDYTLALALFAFGYERSLALRYLADALVSAGLATILITPLGLPGVATGFLLGGILVAVPIDIYLLARELQISILQVVQPYIPYLWRCAVVSVMAYAINQWIEIPNFFVLVAVGLFIGLLYLGVMIPYVWRSELGAYVRPVWNSLESNLRGRVLGWSNNS